MATRSEAPDIAVDELRRRARRRLVGAIVLALTAAVLLPLLLESEPKPLGEDVSIQIPPIDSGKFVNPLTPDKGAAPGKSDDARAKSAPPPATDARPVTPAPAPPTPAAPAPATPAPAAPTATAPAAAPAEAAKAPEPEPAPASAEAPASEAKSAASAPAPEVESKAEVPAKDSGAGNAAKSDAKSAPATKDAAAAGNFIVQVAAFTDRYGAQALVRKLEQQGFPCYSEAATTEKGTVHRVRVGPFPTRDAANAARAKLKAAGYDSMVARTQ